MESSVAGAKSKMGATSKKIIAMRLKKYKPGLPCPGSFFKNIPAATLSEEILKNIPKEKIIHGKVPTGYLLEAVGARGMKCGGVYIADFHGNLIINQGKGTAKDVKKLADLLRSKVREKFGITLEEEVRYF